MAEAPPPLPRAPGGASGGAPVAWPVFGLRVITPRLTLRVPYDAELLRLAERAAGRVLAPEQRMFMGRWTQLPSPEFERSFMQFHWAQRSAVRPGRWGIEFGIHPAGEESPVGMIGVSAIDFARQRSATTGSWLLPEWRGRRLGLEARAAILHLLFDGFGGLEARSGAHAGNLPSHGVSRALGYRHDGTEPWSDVDGEERVTMVRLLLTREDWLPHRRDDISIEGLTDAVRAMLGLDGTA